MKNLRVADGVIPLGEFKSHAARYLKNLDGPMVITQNVRPAGVLLSPAEYDRIREQQSLLESIAAHLACHHQCLSGSPFSSAATAGVFRPRQTGIPMATACQTSTIAARTPGKVCGWMVSAAKPWIENRQKVGRETVGQYGPKRTFMSGAMPDVLRQCASGQGMDAGGFRGQWPEAGQTPAPATGA